MYVESVRKLFAIAPPYHDLAPFRVKLIEGLCFANEPSALLGVPTLARGFSGESTLERENGDVGAGVTFPVLAAFEFMLISPPPPVTFLRIAGRPVGRPSLSPPGSLYLSVSEGNWYSENDVSVPNA